MWNTFLLIILGLLFRLTVQKPTAQVIRRNVANDEDVTFTSPGYEDGHYPLSTEMFWEFHSLSSKDMMLEFLDFDVEAHADCNWDKVEISAGKCNDRIKPVTLCGQVDPGYQFHCNESFLCVSFHSDYIIHRRGFKAIVSSQKDPITSTSETTNSTNPQQTPTSSQLSTTTTKETPTTTASNSSSSESQSTLTSTSLGSKLTSTTSSTSTTKPASISTTSPSKSSSKSTPTSKLTSTLTSKLLTTSTLTTTLKSTSSTTKKASTSSSTSSPTPSSSSSLPPPTTTSSTSLLITSTSSLSASSSFSSSHDFTDSVLETNSNATPSTPSLQTSSPDSPAIHNKFESISTQTPVPTSQTTTTTTASLAPTITTFSSSITEAVTKEITMCQTLNVDFDQQTEMIIVESPVNEYGTYPLDITCPLTVHNKDNMILKIVFQEFNLEKHGNCKWDYLEFSLSGEDSSKFCGDALPMINTTNSPIIDTVFHSDHVVAHKGFTFHITRDYVPTTDIPSTSTTTSTVQSTTIKMTTESPSLSPTSVTTHTNKTQASENGENNSVPDVTTAKANDVTSQSNVLTITSDNDHNGQSTTNNGNHSISTDVTSTTTKPLNSITQSASSPKSSTHDGNTHSTNVVTELKTTTTAPKQMTPPESLEPITVDICNQSSVIVDRTMSIVTPGFLDQRYPLNKQCTITMTTSYDIEFTVETFELETHHKCAWDHLELEYNMTKIKFCGVLVSGSQLTPYGNCNPNRLNVYDVVKSHTVCLFQSGTTVNLKAKNITLTFFSDYIVNKSGFKINVIPHVSNKNTNEEIPLPTTVGDNSDVTTTTESPTTSTPAEITYTAKYVSDVTTTKESTTKHEASSSTTNIDATEVTSTLKSSLSPDSISVNVTSQITTTTASINGTLPTATSNSKSTTATFDITTENPFERQTSTSNTGVTGNVPVTPFKNTTPSSYQGSDSSNFLTKTKQSPIMTTLMSTTVGISTTTKHTTINSSPLVSGTESLDTTSTKIVTYSTAPPKAASSSSPGASPVSEPKDLTVTTTKSVTNTTVPVSQFPTDATDSLPKTSSLTQHVPGTTETAPLTSAKATEAVPTSPETTEVVPNTTRALPTYVTDACSGGDPMILEDVTGFIESPGYRKNEYPPNSSCRWKITGTKPKVVMIVFETFDIEISPNCLWDKLTFYEVHNDGTTLKKAWSKCGNIIPGLFSSKKDIIIEFVSDSITNKPGFRLKYYIIETNTDFTYTCDAGMMPCLDTGTCIPAEWWCDGMADCQDQTDESSCAMCDDNEFQCGNGTCISTDKICDGIEQCPYGTDERSCVSIVEADNNLPVLVNVNNELLPLCYENDVINRTDDICNAAGYRSSVHVQADNTNGFVAYSKLQEDSKSLKFTKSENCPDNKAVLLRCSESGCGMGGEPSRRKRVVGGQVSMKGVWRWSVALRIGDSVVCGGSIINSEWIVTAGHCVFELQDNPQVLSIIAGVNDITDYNREVRYVSEVVMHPNYNFIFNADIALLRLQSPLVFNDDIQPICLPWDRRQFSPYDICYITGYGVSEMIHYHTTVKPRYLRQVKTKIMDQETCKNMYSYKTVIKDSMMCAGYAVGGMDACKGDSGGGLMCRSEQGRWMLAGVVSWGDMCGSRSRPGVYTNVVYFMDWIEEKTNPDAEKSIACNFEQDWCGYEDRSVGNYIWTRKPGDKYVKGTVLHAAKTSASSSGNNKHTNASLISPVFSLTSDSCLSLSIMFRGNSNMTVSVYSVEVSDNAADGQDSDNSHERLGKPLFGITSNYPAMDVWRDVEVAIPNSVTQIMIVSHKDGGGVSGVGLDNITIATGHCQGSKFMECNFDNADTCHYTQSYGQNTAQWYIVPDGNGNHLRTGGGYDDFGYLVTSQLISPALSTSYISIPHCLTFSYNKQSDTNTELIVATYVTIVGELGNQQIYWSSENSPIGQWLTVHVTIPHSMFDHVVFEVSRKVYSTDVVEISLDDIKMADGMCV